MFFQQKEIALSIYNRFSLLLLKWKIINKIIFNPFLSLKPQ
jgi:hypothetical protein